MNEQNPNGLNSTDFSGIPALNDTQGLENYLNQQTLNDLGLPNPTNPQPNPVTPQPSGDGNTNLAQNGDIVNPTLNPNPNPAAPNPAATPTTDVNALVARIDELTKQINALRAQPQTQPQGVTQPQQPRNAYTPAEMQFINAALARGYSMTQIEQTIQNRRAGVPGANPNANSELTNRMANLEKYIQEREYAQAQNAFIDKLSNFGDKWGLSENDLVAFGNYALSKGINIATANIDLETVFKALYPEQYSIRLQRMSNNPTSQIFGGSNVPEGNRQQAARQEDAYVEQFLKSTMPNYIKK
jgi:hypothetical protein